MSFLPCSPAAKTCLTWWKALGIEVGMRNFLSAGNFKVFTTFRRPAWTSQFPGLAVQRLMRDGYGFGAEGDWKTSALVVP